MAAAHNPEQATASQAASHSQQQARTLLPGSIPHRYSIHELYVILSR